MQYIARLSGTFTRTVEHCITTWCSPSTLCFKLFFFFTQRAHYNKLISIRFSEPHCGYFMNGRDTTVLGLPFDKLFIQFKCPENILSIKINDPFPSIIDRNLKAWQTHLLAYSPVNFVHVPFESLKPKAIAAIQLIFIVFPPAIQPTCQEASRSKSHIRVNEVDGEISTSRENLLALVHVQIPVQGKIKQSQFGESFLT